MGSSKVYVVNVILLTFFNLLVTSFALPFVLLKRPLATLKTGLFRDWPCLCFSFFPIFFLLERKENIFEERRLLSKLKYSFFFLFINVFHSFQTSGAQ